MKAILHPLLTAALLMSLVGCVDQKRGKLDRDSPKQKSVKRSNNSTADTGQPQQTNVNSVNWTQNPSESDNSKLRQLDLSEERKFPVTIMAPTDAKSLASIY